MPEIINSETGEVLERGETGELVITTLTKQGIPLLRYRTKDITRINYEPCACGRTHARMDKVKGRSDDMLKIRGVNVFPSQIETVLLERGYSPNYQIIVDRVGSHDTLEVIVEMTPDMFSDTVRSISAWENDLTEALKSLLGLAAKVTLVEPKSIERSTGKAVRVIDKRKLHD